ncbi:ParB/RepB/Spo0J family partition protein [bacterium]|nr:ParB/RepB/Spo0J family partition protein [bacterium]
MSKKALGKGLADLLAVDDIEGTSPDGSLNAGVSQKHDNGVVSLKLEEILQNPLQPRRRFDEGKLQELADSIKAHGVVQPVIVKRVAEGYRLIVGERRCRASKMAGLAEIPAIVRDFADQEMLEIALIENLQREDLNPIEEAQAYQYLLREHEMTHDQLAERLGCSRSAVSNALRLLTLSDEMRKDLEDGVITPGHARALLSLTDENLRYRAWQMIKKDSLSVRQAEALVARLAQDGEAKPNNVASKPSLGPDWEHIVEVLRERLNADVRLIPRSKGKGRLELHYNSQKELENLVNILIYESSR